MVHRSGREGAVATAATVTAIITAVADAAAHATYSAGVGGGEVRGGEHEAALPVGYKCD